MVFRKIRKSRSQKPERQFLSYSDINSCLLIWGIGRDEDLEQLIELENMLKADGKQVISCCYKCQRDILACRYQSCRFHKERLVNLQQAIGYGTKSTEKQTVRCSIRRRQTE